MKLNTNSILILFGIIAFAIMACFPVTLMALPLLKPPQPTQANAFATVQAIVTQTMIAMTQNAPTAIPATATPVPPTSTPVPPTNTPLPTAVTYCDWVKFIKDVTIPDGTQLLTGEVFTKTWRLQNRGTCTWTPDYMLVYVSGDPMGGTTAVRLPAYVYPGQTIDLSVTLTAPNATGHYTSYWMLRNQYGALFGAGNRASEAFFADIRTKADVQYGTITGHLSYPSEFIPAMRVIAFNLSNGRAYYIDTASGQGSYALSVPAGSYYVVSYPFQGLAGRTGQVNYYNLSGGPFSGGYTQMVPCGLTADCNNHTLLTVVVSPGQIVMADPGDWYAPIGTFPPMP